MYTFQQIYDYLNSGTEAPAPGPFREPSAAPGSTMKSLQEIYEAVATPFAQCNAGPADVKSSVTFFSTQAEGWGVQTGTWIQATATPTPTPIP